MPIPFQTTCLGTGFNRRRHSSIIYRSSNLKDESTKKRIDSTSPVYVKDSASNALIQRQFKPTSLNVQHAFSCREDKMPQHFPHAGTADGKTTLKMIATSATWKNTMQNKLGGPNTPARGVVAGEEVVEADITHRQPQIWLTSIMQLPLTTPYSAD